MRFRKNKTYTTRSGQMFQFKCKKDYLLSFKGGVFIHIADIPLVFSNKYHQNLSNQYRQNSDK